MANNKVEAFGQTLIDLTEDKVTPETLAKGVTAHNAAGDKITGTMEGQVVDILSTKEELEANTEAGKVVDALVVKDINSSLESNNEHFYYDVQNGVRGFNTDPARGADTFYPFDKGKAYKITVVAVGGVWNPAGWISPRVETTTVITIHKDGTHSYTGGSRALSSATIDTSVANQKGAVQIKSVTVKEIKE